jgi:putative MATE family efflux protein
MAISESTRQKRSQQNATTDSISTMQDLTQGSVIRHLLNMAGFMAISMLIQTLYLLADLYWVSHLGKEAIAAVSVAGTLNMIILALTQILGVGTTTLISQAVGRKDHPHAELIFNQSITMSILTGLSLGTCGFLLRDWYCHALSADTTTADLAKTYLIWFIPALALQFPLVTLGSALRATGVIKPAVAFPVLSVLLNIFLAPVFIFGTGQEWPKLDLIRRFLAHLVSVPSLGVIGAAIATFVSILLAEILMLIYFERKYHYLRFRRPLLWPRIKTWWSMLRIGLPPGAEFALLFVYMFVVYLIIRNFGSAAQAGFGIGSRVMQALFLPVVALSFAVGPVVGQNFGGRRADRVRHSVYAALRIACIMMFVLTLIVFFFPAVLIRVFSNDEHVIAFGSEYLRIVSLNFVAAGIVFTVSSVFQGIGNTWPPLLSSATRLFVFALPALFISRMPGFQLKQLWYLSMASQIFQAGINLLLLRSEMRRKLDFRDEAGAAAVEA